MIVRYIGSESDSWLVRGAEYVVLAVSATPRAADPLTFMVHRPDKGAWDWAWWPIELFEVVSNTLPSNWIYSHDEYGFDLMPAAWRRPGHWDDLDPSELDSRPHDVQQAAMRRAWADYLSERDKILKEAGRPPGYQGLPRPSCAWRPQAPDDS